MFDATRPYSRRAFLAAAGLALGGAGRAADPAAAFPPPRFLREWGTRGKGEGEFNIPLAVAVNAADEVYVTDFYNTRVQKFTAEGKFLAAFPVPPYPGGIAVGPGGEVYVSHFPVAKTGETPRPDRVTVYGPDGKPLRECGRSGSGNGEFSWPGGLAFGPGGRLYVADQPNRRVQVFDARGKFLFKWGEYGTGPGQFGGNTSPKARTGGPQFVAVDSKGHVYTTEASVGRVQVFTAEGKFLRAWG